MINDVKASVTFAVVTHMSLYLPSGEVSLELPLEKIELRHYKPRK